MKECPLSGMYAYYWKLLDYLFIIHFGITLYRCSSSYQVASVFFTSSRNCSNMKLSCLGLILILSYHFSTSSAGSLNCPSGEIFRRCKIGCPAATCDNPRTKPCTAGECTPGCECPLGQVRGYDGKCVGLASCYRTPTRRPAPCPPGELYQQCATSCPATCDNPTPGLCNLPCKPGCECAFDQVRGPGNRCIDLAWCPKTTTPAAPTCPPGEIFRQCATKCPATCDNPNPGPCLIQCEPGCECPFGQLRGPNNRCTDLAWCPKTTPAVPSCPPGEVFWECATDCPATCDNPRPGPCGCSPGCECPVGQVRRVPNDRCIDLAWCPKPTTPAVPSCPPGEIFRQCATKCPATCDNPNPGPCLIKCEPGCECPFGQLRGPNNRCTDLAWCPKTTPAVPSCPPGEVFWECATDCPATCDNPRPGPCGCSPGCECPVGQVRGPNNRCIDLAWCPPKPTTPAVPSCPAGEVYRQCASKCPATCDNPNPGLCPFKCTPGCECPFGEVRGPGYRCIDLAWCPPVRTNPKQPTTKPSGICGGQPDGAYEDPAQPCARHFFYCVGGRDTKEVCPSGTFFDVWSGECLQKQYVPACGGQETQKPPAVTASPTPAPFAFDCSFNIDGNYPDPTKKCSPFYVTCSAGLPVFRECQGGLAYDPDLDLCSEPEYVKLCGGAPTVPTKPAQPVSTVPPFDYDCWGIEDGYYENPSNPCSDHYVACAGQEPLFLTCPGGLFYDSASESCSEQAYVTGCGGRPTTVAPAIPRVPADYDCRGLPDGYYTNLNECSERYFACVGELAEEMICPSGTVYDNEVGFCHGRSYVRVCGGAPTDAPAEPTSGIPSPECESLGRGSHPTEGAGSCTKSYFVCGAGNERRDEQCPGKTWYDELSGQCLFRRQVLACQGAAKP